MIRKAKSGSPSERRSWIKPSADRLSHWRSLHNIDTNTRSFKRQNASNYTNSRLEAQRAHYEAGQSQSTAILMRSVKMPWPW